jgi:hypothetical protein
VKRDVAPAVAGGPGGDRDQGGADGGGARFRQGAGSEGAGSADQVEGRGRDDQPGGVRVEMTRWQVREGAVVQVGEDLPGDGVAAVEAAERAL